MSSASTVVMALVLVAASRTGFATGSDLTPEQARILESVRASALDYSSSLPNFICTQITHRETSRFGGFPGTVINGTTGSDAIEERLTYVGQKETYQVVSINGQKAEGQDRTEFYGAMSAGEFGSTLREIFDPESQTVFTWVKMTKVSGRSAYVFGFRVPQANGATVTHRETNQTIVAPFGGEIDVDQESFAVLRIHSTLELPKTFPIQMSELTVVYQQVKIADKTYMLPVHSEVRVKDIAHLYVNRIDFRNYQKFGTEMTIQFDDPTPQ